MIWRDKVSVAWSNLGRRKVRTVLTSTGVVVGVMTVVTMVSLVNGVHRQVKQQFEKIGLDRVVVRPRTEGGGVFGGFDPFGFSERIKPITAADVQRWKAWPEVQRINPEIELPGGLTSGLRLAGKTVPVRLGSDSTPRRGPFAEAPTALFGTLEVPDARGNLVVSRGTLQDLKLPSSQFASILGRNVEVVLVAPRGEKQNYRFKIIGVSSEKNRTAQVSTRDRLAMKEWWFKQPNLLQAEGYDSVTLRAADVSDAKILVGRLRKEKFEVQSIDAILDVANRIFSVITLMLALVSSVALLVASLGIINTMIMSIYERTREIGTLKAMGASRSDIRQMFMMEAGMIGLLGGVLGLFSGWLLGRGLNYGAIWFARQRALPVPENLFIITPALALQALFFALLIGVLAGVYPASRAARLDPLKALRQE